MGLAATVRDGENETGLYCERPARNSPCGAARRLLVSKNANRILRGRSPESAASGECDKSENQICSSSPKTAKCQPRDFADRHDGPPRSVIFPRPRFAFLVRGGRLFTNSTSHTKEQASFHRNACDETADTSCAMSGMADDAGMNGRRTRSVAPNQSSGACPFTRSAPFQTSPIGDKPALPSLLIGWTSALFTVIARRDAVRSGPGCGSEPSAANHHRRAASLCAPSLGAAPRRLCVARFATVRGVSSPLVGFCRPDACLWALCPDGLEPSNNSGRARNPGQHFPARSPGRTCQSRFRYLRPSPDGTGSI